MNEHREPFERELQRMLSVDPSPDLQRRIRARAYAGPARRSRWFALAPALAGLAVATVFVVIYIQPRNIENVSPAVQVVVQTVTPVPSPPVEKPTSVRRASVVPHRPAIMPARLETAVDVAAGIEVPELAEFELTTSIQPIPQPAVFSAVSLNSPNIEPFVLTVRNLGVSE